MYQNLFHGTKWYHWPVQYTFFLPNEHSKESPFSLCLVGTYCSQNSLLMPTIRYLGTNENILSLEALKNMYQLIASSLEQARNKRDTKALVQDRILSEGYAVLLKDHTTCVWDP